MGSFDEDDFSNLSKMYNTLYGRPTNDGQRASRSWFISPLFRNSTYAPVQDADGKTENETTLELELRKKDTTIRTWQYFSGVLTVLLITLFVLSLKPRSRYPQPGEGTENLLKWMKDAETIEGHDWCGATITEAKNKGCTFSKLHNRWISPHCAAEFEPAREALLKAVDGDETDFIFYGDDNGKPGAKLSDEELNELDILTPAWTTMSHHATHCMYLLLQAAASLNLGTKAERVVHVWEHAEHCASVIMNLTRTAPGWDDVVSFGHTQSAVCW